MQLPPALILSGLPSTSSAPHVSFVEHLSERDTRYYLRSGCGENYVQKTGLKKPSEAFPQAARGCMGPSSALRPWHDPGVCAKPGGDPGMHSCYQDGGLGVVLFISFGGEAAYTVSQLVIKPVIIP